MLAATDSAHGSGVLRLICWLAIFEAIAGDARVPARVVNERLETQSTQDIVRGRQNASSECVTREERTLRISFLINLNTQDRIEFFLGIAQRNINEPETTFCTCCNQTTAPFVCASVLL